MSTITSPALRERRFGRLESVAERNKEMPFEEVGSDIAEAIAENP